MLPLLFKMVITFTESSVQTHVLYRCLSLNRLHRMIRVVLNSKSVF